MPCYIHRKQIQIEYDKKYFLYSLCQQKFESSN